MPRRIPDYPDAFAGWNQICSAGSFLSVFSTCLFFYIVFDMLITQYLLHKNNPWKHYPQEVALKIPTKSVTEGFNGTNWTHQTFAFFGIFSPAMEFDAPEKWQMNFQDPATPVMEKIIDLHHDIQFFLIIIVIAVLWILIRIVWLFNETNTKTIRFAFDHHTHLELIWTIIPTIILILIAIPSFALLYAVDELHNPKITMKALGNQWYWSYEFSDYVVNGPEDSIKIDSYMVLEDDLQKGQLRLLEVDERILLPEHISVRVLVTSRDVIHSWAVPSLGVKMDACPGRLNQVGLFIRRKGVYFGQCSELCGINHAFMPIVVEAVSLRDYKEWILKKSPSF
jgi:cytochrome c oxidase subunit 2